MPNVGMFSVEKRYLCQQAWKYHLWHVIVFKRPEHNAKGCPMQLNFEGLDMQKWNIGMIRAQRIFWSLKCQKWLFFVFSSDDSKNLVAVWTKHVSASERSYLNHSENAMDYEVLNYH